MLSITAAILIACIAAVIALTVGFIFGMLFGFGVFVFAHQRADGELAAGLAEFRAELRSIEKSTAAMCQDFCCGIHPHDPQGLDDDDDDDGQQPNSAHDRNRPR